MATISIPTADPLALERKFFLAMALLLIASALLGFGYFQYAGISSWGAPWWVHVHAVSQMGWLGFYAVQNALVVRGDQALHRKLGIFGVVFAGWIVVAAFGVSYLTVATGGGDGMFTPAQLLALNWTNITGFAVLFVAAVIQRGRSDWHKRLMLCALIVLSLPGMGRILIMLGIPSTLNRALILLAFIAIGMIFDWRTRGKVHPAYFWGVGVVLVNGILTAALPDFAPFSAFANTIAG